MFENIGEKIKMLAKCMTWLGIICSVIIGLVVLFADNTLIFVGLLIIVIGSVCSWISSFIIYGFGELVQNSSIISKKLINDSGNVSLENDNTIKQNVEQEYSCNKNSAMDVAQNSIQDEDAVEELIVENSEENYLDVKCPNCKEELSFPESTKSAVCPWCNTTFNL